MEKAVFRREALLPDAELAIGETCRNHFEPPELPGAVMVGVSDVVGGDHAVKMELEATIPTRARTDRGGGTPTATGIREQRRPDGVG